MFYLLLLRLFWKARGEANLSEQRFVQFIVGQQRKNDGLIHLIALGEIRLSSIKSFAYLL